MRYVWNQSVDKRSDKVGVKVNIKGQVRLAVRATQKGQIGYDMTLMSEQGQSSGLVK